MRQARNSAEAVGFVAAGRLLLHDLRAAQTAACAAVGKIQFDGMHFHRDIAAQAITLKSLRLSTGVLAGLRRILRGRYAILRPYLCL